MVRIERGETDDALRRLAHPTTPVTPELEDELARLTVATMRTSRSWRSRNAWKIPVTIGLPALAVLGVGAAAMAAGLWAPWAESPEGSFYFELPSGVRCEQRVGDLQAQNPDIHDVLRDIFSSTDVVARSDVDGWNQRLLGDESVLEYAHATVQSDASPGFTTVPDVIYGMAVTRAVLETVDVELDARGFDMSDEQNAISVRGQSLCGEDLS